ncbi:MAG: 50S ribosomal protein L18 [Pedosphaera sp.]|nr:50S ribosomal protein L18 [Pedosphaera sp.]
MKPQIKQQREQRRRWSVRKRIVGTAARPRMSVRFTGKNIHVQFVDDATGHTLVHANTLKKDAGAKSRANKECAGQLGKTAAAAALEKGIKQVVFDRSGSQYHGKVEVLAQAAREAGLIF